MDTYMHDGGAHLAMPIQTLLLCIVVLFIFCLYSVVFLHVKMPALKLEIQVSRVSTTCKSHFLIQNVRNMTQIVNTS